MARKPLISVAMLSLLEERDRHAWTLEGLQAGLAERGVIADFSSVFRAAEKLAADGVICKVLLDDGRARFEPAGAHHDHLHCTGCDALMAVPCIVERGAFSALEAEIGVAITEHRIVLSGLCPACRAIS